jgi:hypothetical protein
MECHSGVAVGSSIGHAIGSFFGGGSAPVEQATQAQATQQEQSQGYNCGPAVQQFTKCMDDHNGNMQICNWYLEQLVCLRVLGPSPTFLPYHPFFFNTYGSSKYGAERS